MGNLTGKQFCLRKTAVCTAMTIMMQAPFAMSSWAQENAEDQSEPSSSTSLETIIVTATRREQSIQDVPLSISAYDPKELTEKGIVGYDGLALETPGVVLNKASANFNNFTARGISTNGYGAGLQSTVAIYIDEVPISANGNSTIIDPNLFDVERVEFLRGPQGTLFGSGSLAGAVRILNKEPELDAFDYSLVVDLGDTDSGSLRQRYNGMVNIPLVEDKVALRLVGFHRDEEGYLDNVGTGVENSNTLVGTGGRAILAAQITDRLDIKLLSAYEESKPEDSFLTSPRFGDKKRISDRPDRFTAELVNHNLTADYQFDGAILTSSSSFTTFDQEFYVDLAGTFQQAIPFALDADGYDDVFVEELRLVSTDGDRFDWVVGGFYFDKRRHVDFNYRSSNEFLAQRGLTGLPNEYYARFKNYTDILEIAGFGELTYNISDTLSLTGGLRYGSVEVQTTTESGGYQSNYLTAALVGLTGPLTVFDVPAGVGEKAEESGFSYKASLSYRPSSNLTAYATYATGFRNPVVNARAGQGSLVDANDIIIPQGADSDELRSYEIGLKGNWLDGNLHANVAAYYIDWSNIQVQANRVSDSVQFATNIGQAESKGIEFEVGMTPMSGLFLGVNGSFNNAEVSRLSGEEAAISGAVLGSRLAAPKFQGSAFMKYTFDFGANHEGFVNASIQHVGSYPSQFPNLPGNPTVQSPTYDTTDSYELVNFSFGASFGDLTISAYVENAFDDDSITYVHPEQFIDSRYGIVRPRTIGIRLSKGI